jgi:periplasmic protein TonB
LTRILPIAAALLIAACAEDVPETAPRQLAGSPFHYPEELWDAGVEGETLLRLFVTEGGAVDSVEVERTSGYESFDSAAVRGARELRFEPGLRGDTPVGTWVLLPVQFDFSSATEPNANP